MKYLIIISAIVLLIFISYKLFKRIRPYTGPDIRFRLCESFFSDEYVYCQYSIMGGFWTSILELEQDCITNEWGYKKKYFKIESYGYILTTDNFYKKYTTIESIENMNKELDDEYESNVKKLSEYRLRKKENLNKALKS